jgi:hypothetical protein
MNFPQLSKSIYILGGGPSGLAAEDVDGPLHGVIPQGLPAHGPESIDAFAEIHRLGGQKDAALGG